MLVAIVCFAYGAVAQIDAVLRYRKAHSVPGLLAGLISGTVLDVSGALVLLGIPIGPAIGVGAALAMLGVFGSRYLELKTKPAGVVLAVSVVATAILFAEIFP